MVGRYRSPGGFCDNVIKKTQVNGTKSILSHYLQEILHTVNIFKSF